MGIGSMLGSLNRTKHGNQKMFGKGGVLINTGNDSKDKKKTDMKSSKPSMSKSQKDALRRVMSEMDDLALGWIVDSQSMYHIRSARESLIVAFPWLGTK